MSEPLPIVKGKHEPDPERCLRCHEQMNTLWARAAAMLNGTVKFVEHDEPEVLRP